MRHVRITACSRWLSHIPLVMMLLWCISCSTANTANQTTSSAGPTKAPSSSGTTVHKGTQLPGQQIWKGNVSSLLFGTNDTYEWSSHNLQTEPAMQQALHDAGFTLIRSFFPDKASDADIEQRINTIENSGAHCLGVITNIANTAFDEHLVGYLGNRCLMYEFGNESDVNGYSIDAYLHLWNSTIPLLRAINPNAWFIGPVTYNERGNHDFLSAFLQGVKASGVLPDAISFHKYACYQDSESYCLQRVSEYGQAVAEVRQEIQSILGKNLPIGITEWNFDSGNPPPSYGDNPSFITTFTNAALQSMIKAGVAFACQFDAASYAGYGHLDLFDVHTNVPKAQYYAIKAIIAQYRSAS